MVKHGFRGWDLVEYDAMGPQEEFVYSRDVPNEPAKEELAYGHRTKGTKEIIIDDYAIVEREYVDFTETDDFQF